MKTNVPNVTRPAKQFEPVGKIVDRIVQKTAEVIEENNKERRYSPSALISVLKANK